jgi:hypothetical protein
MEAFVNCTSLTSVIIGESVTVIGYMAFWGCSSLTSVIIGEGVTVIGDVAFYGCRSLTSVICLPTTPPTLDFFDGSSSLAIKVPLASVNAYKSASGWSEYASIISAIE